MALDGFLSFVANLAVAARVQHAFEAEARMLLGGVRCVIRIQDMIRSGASAASSSDDRSAPLRRWQQACSRNHLAGVGIAVAWACDKVKGAKARMLRPLVTHATIKITRSVQVP